MLVTNIYVPLPGSGASALVAPRSAIVGAPSEHLAENCLCYFEGGIYRSPGEMSFFSKLRSAAGRLRDNYPTTSVACFPAADLCNVGCFDTTRFVVIAISDEARLCHWAGESIEDIIGPRLPLGAHSWGAMTELVQAPHTRPLIPSNNSTHLWFKTQAGQLLRFNLDGQTAFVHEHTDPYVRTSLVAAGFSGIALSSA